MKNIKSDYSLRRTMKTFFSLAHMYKYYGVEANAREYLNVYWLNVGTLPYIRFFFACRKFC
jgi:hypothetical protein